jgi:type I restriction enzyme M protein
MHGIEEFKIVRGDTLAEPGLLENDQLKTFNVILANPPYSIKSWDQKSFINDPWGRNLWGTPPQGCADYAFQQHIQKSLDKNNGRSISLWPHGILFRDSEAEIRRNMIDSDVVEAVIGLGPNLFYNSPMEACLLITNNNKPENKKGKILFINAVKEVRNEKTMSFLSEQHIDKIFNAFKQYDTISDFSVVIDNNEVLEGNKGNLSISLYVRPDALTNTEINNDFKTDFQNWKTASETLSESMNQLFQN